MPTFAAVEDAELEPSACWCCGAIDAPERMVHLGNHPEVALCLGCARWAAKEAWEIEDRGRTGLVVRARDRFRLLRRGVARPRMASASRVRCTVALDRQAPPLSIAPTSATCECFGSAPAPGDMTHERADDPSVP